MSVISISCGQVIHPYPTSMFILRAPPPCSHLLQVPNAGQCSCPCVAGSQQSCAVMSLFILPLPTGKCPKENMEALEEFKKFTQHKGLLQENIIVPQQRGERILCPLPHVPSMSPMLLQLLSNHVPSFTSRALLVISIMRPSEGQVYSGSSP